MGTWMSRANTRHKPFFFLSQTFLSARTMEVLPSFCSIGTIIPPRPAHNECRRAQRRSRMARLRATASAARSVLDGREHGGTLGRVGEPILTNRTIKKRTQRPQKPRSRSYDTRRSPLYLAVIFRSSRHILVCGESCRIPTMMQIYASVARLRSSGAHSYCRHESHADLRAPLPRIAFGDRHLKASGAKT